MDETQLVQRVRKELHSRGWTLCEKTHGNQFQKGWPDLFCYHPTHGCRWVEVKLPKGRLTRAQRARFKQWSGAGCGIHVITTEKACHELLMQPGNVESWLTKGRISVSTDMRRFVK